MYSRLLFYTYTRSVCVIIRKLNYAVINFAPPNWLFLDHKATHSPVLLASSSSQLSPTCSSKTWQDQENAPPRVEKDTQNIYYVSDSMFWPNDVFDGPSAADNHCFFCCRSLCRRSRLEIGINLKGIRLSQINRRNGPVISNRYNSFTREVSLVNV